MTFNDNKAVIFCLGASIGMCLMAAISYIAPTDGIQIIKLSGIGAGIGLICIFAGYQEELKKKRLSAQTHDKVSG